MDRVRKQCGRVLPTTIEQVLSEVANCARAVSVDSLLKAERLVETSTRIFVAGAGRSGLCMRAFGMRLMHLGKTIYVVGETNTPGVNAADLLILASGSGKTASMLGFAERARKNKARILLFTTDATSPLAVIADYLVVIPAPSFKATGETRDSITSQPLGSLFEQTLWILCDSLILGVMQQTGVTAQAMFERHANLE